MPAAEPGDRANHLYFTIANLEDLVEIVDVIQNEFQIQKPAGSPQEIDQGFELIARQKAQAVLVMSSPLFDDLHDQIATLAQRARIPCVGDSGRGFAALRLSPYGRTANRRDGA